MTVAENPIRLIDIYQILLEYFGERKWWDAESEFEIIIGSILAQNTNWNNAEKSVQNIKNSSLLEPGKLIDLSSQDLADLIRPSGFFNQKTKKIKSFLEFFDSSYQFSI
ncbi:MAG: hypothetical protein GY863_08835, partial [bacterium]|nr:hypothetical protein [bacterium]